jgi:hypothetical protein
VSVHWYRVQEVLPPEQIRVRTISSCGWEEVLFRHGSLWFHGDSRVAVYYTPLFWLPLEEKEQSR